VSDDESKGRRPEAGLIHALLDQLASDFAAPPFRAQIATAREEYFVRAGKVFEDDAEVYEARTVAFLEWYVVERPLPEGRPPVLVALESTPSDAANADRRMALARIATSHRSLFDIAKVEGNRVELEDVLGGARFSVVERRSTIGFEVGAIVEARVVWDGTDPLFTKTFLFHPRDARTEILNLVDDSLMAGASRDDIMGKLSQLYLRWHRHGHLNAGRIYKGGHTGNTAGPVVI
jgi:hypothetical protein